jgi:hypothetical protein
MESMRLLLPVTFAVLLASAAQATDLVVFEDGRGLRVSGFELADGLARLTLEEGGELGVPMRSIVAIERAIVDVSILCRWRTRGKRSKRRLWRPSCAPTRPGAPPRDATPT